MTPPRLTKRQRELLLEIVDRGAVEIPYGMGGIPHRVLRERGLVYTKASARGFHGTKWVSAPTGAGRALAAELRA